MRSLVQTIVACVVLALSASTMRVALAFECLNRDGLARVTQATGGELMHEFVGDDGDRAIGVLNLFTQPEQALMGEQLLLWNYDNRVLATVLMWRGGGYCVVSQRVLSRWQAARISDAVLGQ